MISAEINALEWCTFILQDEVGKNYDRDLAEFAPGELYTDQYKVKVNDLVSRSRSKVNSQDDRIHAPCTMTLTKKRGQCP